MKGIQAPTVKYTLERDRDPDVPQKERTTWHIKIFTPVDQVRVSKRLNRAIKVGAGSNTADIDDRNYLKAQKGDWQDAVQRVENYQFGYKFEEERDKGYIKNIEDPDMIMRIFEDIPTAVRDEILKVSTGDIQAEYEVDIGDIDPKKSNLPSTT